MPARYDVIVAGLGAMGSAACFHLARAGRRVLGLDRFTPPHTLGSSHGQTRIIREAYFEDPLYVPLVQRAYILWEELARAAQTELFIQTGGLMISAPEATVFRGARQSAEQHRLAHELLTGAQVRSRFPVLQPTDDMSAVWEPRAGILFPERCVAAHLAQAAAAGADLRYEEPITRWEPDGAGIRVATPQSSYPADQLILAAGPWMPSLLTELNLPLRIERQVQFWFEPVRTGEGFSPKRCPIHLWQFDGRRFFYGFPDLGQGVKVAGHHDGLVTDPDSVQREVAPEEVESMRRILRRFLPMADGRLVSTAVCLYTNTPDEHFFIDRHPRFAQVLLASPCSGHGFKFSSAIGEVLSDLAVRGQSTFDLSLFRRRW